MFEDDGFYLDDDELGEDNQMTLVEEAVFKTVEAMEKTLKEFKDNLRFREIQDQESQVRILSSHLDSILKLRNIDTSELSEEEIFEEIENVYKRTTELTFSNIDNLLPDPEEEKIDGLDIGPLDTDNSTDW